MSPPTPPGPRVAVIGGGLAGITAAIALAEAGAAVTLLEARPRLGGATCSFTRDGLVVDTGQHVFLGCCTAYRGLLDRLGMTAHAPLQDRFDVSVLAPDPSSPAGQVRRGRLRRTALPGPLHMLPALARYPFLSVAERSVVSRPALALRRVDPADPVVDEQRFGDWLAARGQDERARRALWDLFTVSALNIAGDDASLALAATVVKTGLLGRNNAADIGVPALPLGELHGDAAATRLAKLGARVLIGAKVAAIEADADAERGRPSRPRFRLRLARPAGPADLADLADPDDPGAGASADASLADVSPASDASGIDIAADAVVLAVPHEAAARLMPPGALPDGTVAGWAGLGASPIVNVHVIYDRQVTDLPFAAAVDSPVQWVFDRTRISGLDRSSPAKQYLAISLSAADEYVDVPAARLREQFVPALAELFPAARDARVVEFFVTRERRATFRQAPGSARLRPRAGTQLPGLMLAGAWTATGWPDTMEGAVRSGLAAAIELRNTVLSSRVSTEPNTYTSEIGVRP
ncbi:MAG TPA: FAD-dependent oxidoreductase [Streptosporangiaceae bacterium]|nr:FAD-dependent oxidoreductase [Streptosporangiaceae bacterium]